MSFFKWTLNFTSNVDSLNVKGVARGCVIVYLSS